MYQLSSLEKNFNSFIENLIEPSWMIQSRYDAFKKYTALPLESSALYSKYSNANKMMADNIFFDNKIQKEDEKNNLEIFSDRLDELSKNSSILCKNSRIIKTFLPDDFKKKGIIITNITDRSATISWKTDKPTEGKVVLREGDFILPISFALTNKNVFYDDRDVADALIEAAKESQASVEEVKIKKQGKYYLHHVTVKNLNPDKAYSFKIKSGSFYVANACYSLFISFNRAYSVFLILYYSYTV